MTGHHHGEFVSEQLSAAKPLPRYSFRCHSGLVTTSRPRPAGAQNGTKSLVFTAFRAHFRARARPPDLGQGRLEPKTAPNQWLSKLFELIFEPGSPARSSPKQTPLVLGYAHVLLRFDGLEINPPTSQANPTFFRVRARPAAF